MGEIKFSPEYSSNSTRVPRDFSWSTTEGNVQVWIDMGIIQGANEPWSVNKYGWVLESRAICPQIFMWLKQNYKEVLTKYNVIFTGDEELLALDDRFQFAFPNSVLPWIKETEYGIYPKTKLCSMIASQKQMCPGHLLRWQVAKQAIDSGRVDVRGGAHGTPKFGIDESMIHPDKTSMLKDYMFSIVMENASYNTYFTEKLTDCFALGTVPVYWGCPNIGNYFNPDGIITLSDNFDINRLCPDLYYGMMPAIKDNLEKVKRLKGTDDYLWDNYFAKHK